METPRRSILRRPDSAETLPASGLRRKVTFTPSPSTDMDYSPVERMLKEELAERGMDGMLKWVKSMGVDASKSEALQALPAKVPHPPAALRRSDARSFASEDVKEEPEEEWPWYGEGPDYDYNEYWSDYEAFMAQGVKEEPVAEKRRAEKAQPLATQRPTARKSSVPPPEPAKPLVIKRTVIPHGHDKLIVQKKTNIFDSSTWGKKEPSPGTAERPVVHENTADVAPALEAAVSDECPVVHENTAPALEAAVSDESSPLHGLSQGCGKKAVRKFLRVAYSMDEWYVYCDERRGGEYELQKDDPKEVAHELLLFRTWLGQKAALQSDDIEARMRSALKLHREGDPEKAREEILRCLGVLEGTAGQNKKKDKGAALDVDPSEEPLKKKQKKSAEVQSVVDPPAPEPVVPAEPSAEEPVLRGEDEQNKKKKAKKAERVADNVTPNEPAVEPSGEKQPSQQEASDQVEKDLDAQILQDLEHVVDSVQTESEACLHVSNEFLPSFLCEVGASSAPSGLLGA